jgi:hypothetical protein
VLSLKKLCEVSARQPKGAIGEYLFVRAFHSSPKVNRAVIWPYLQL